MKRIFLFSLISICMCCIIQSLKAQTQQQFDHKIILKCDSSENLTFKIKLVKDNPKDKTILVDWGDGKVIEHLSESNELTHVYTQGSQIARQIIIEGADITEIKNLSSGIVLGLQSMDAPKLSKLEMNDVNLKLTPDVNLSNLPKLREVYISNIRSFTAPSSLEIFDYKIYFNDPIFIESLDVTKAANLKTLVASSGSQAFHHFKELDLSNNISLETLILAGSPRSMTPPTLTTIKGIREIKSFKECNVSYLALDLNNLPTKQNDSQAKVRYDNQQFIIPLSKIEIRKVDLSYLKHIHNGIKEGDYDTEFNWFIYTGNYYTNGTPISKDKYTEENGVFTFQEDLFGEKLSGKILCTVTNKAYPDLMNTKSDPIKLFTKDTNHLFTISAKGNSASQAKVSFDVFTQKKEGKKWINDKEVKSGDYINPGSNLSIRANWQNGSKTYIVKHWIINDQIFTKKDKQDKEYEVTFNPLYYKMPETGALDIQIELNSANLVYGLILPKGVDKNKEKDFKIKAFIKDTKTNDKEYLYGQEIGDFTYGYYRMGIGNKYLIIQTSLPDGYTIKQWTLNGEKIDGKEVEKNFYKTGKYNFKIFAEIESTLPAKDKISVNIEGLPKEYVDSLGIYINQGNNFVKIANNSLVEMGQTIRASVFAKKGYIVNQFNVNGLPYQGKIDKDNSKFSIDLVANQALNIVANLTEAEKNSQVYYTQKGEGMVNGFLANNHFDIIESKNFESGTKIDEKQNYTIMSTPKSGYQMTGWTFSYDYPIENVSLPTDAPLIKFDATAEEIKDFESKTGRTSKTLICSYSKRPVNAYLGGDSPSIVGIVYNIYVDPIHKGIVIYTKEGPNSGYPQMKTMLKAMGYGDPIEENEGNHTLQWIKNGISAKIQVINELDSKVFEGAKSALVIQCNDRFNSSSIANNNINITGQFEEIPTALVQVKINNPNLATANIMVAKDDNSEYTHIDVSNPKITFGQTIRIDINVNNPEYTKVDSILINGDKQPGANIETKGLKPFTLNNDYTVNGILDVTIYVSSIENANHISSGTTVSKEGQNIYIQSTNRQEYIIYAIDGKIIKRGITNNTTSKIFMHRGLYIIKVGRSIYKIAIE